MVWSTQDSSGSDCSSAIAEGIVSDTLIATPEGWRTAVSLQAGQRVLTFDHGEQKISSIQVMPFWAEHQSHWPLLVPVGAMENREEVILLPEQKVMIESDVAEELFGEAFVLVPALALESWRGIGVCRPPAGKAVVQIGFDEPQILYASRNLMLSCPGDAMQRVDFGGPSFLSCSMSQARHLIACIMAEEAGVALREARQHQIQFRG